MDAYRNTTLIWYKGLASMPIAIATASSDDGYRLDRVGPSGGGIGRYEYDKGSEECEECGLQKKVNPSDIKKGILTGDSFAEIPAEALEEITKASKLDYIEVQDFMDLKDVPFDRSTGRYFIYVPKQHGDPRSLRALWEILRKAKKVAVAKWTASSRQKLVVISAQKDGSILMNTLTFADNAKKPDSDVLAHMREDIKIKRAHITEGVRMINEESREKSFLDTAQDDAIILLRKQVNKALQGHVVKTPEPATTQALTQIENFLEDRVKSSSENGQQRGKEGTKEKGRAKTT